MINHFIWIEIILYVLPFVTAFYGIFILKPQIKEHSITVSTCLLPTWLLIINAFSLLIYNFSILPILFTASVFILVLFLHDYIRRIDKFYMLDFFDDALRILFMSWTFFLVGMMFARLLSYFFV